MHESTKKKSALGETRNKESRGVEKKKAQKILNKIKASTVPLCSIIDKREYVECGVNELV